MGSLEASREAHSADRSAVALSSVPPWSAYCPILPCPGGGLGSNNAALNESAPVVWMSGFRVPVKKPRKEIGLIKKAQARHRKSVEETHHCSSSKSYSSHPNVANDNEQDLRHTHCC